MIALGGGALGSERVREALASPHGRPPRGRARGGVAAGVRQGPAARPRPRPLRAAARRPLGASTSRWPTRCCRPAERDALRRALPALLRARRGAARHPARVGLDVVGRLPGLPRPRAVRVGLLLPGRRPALRGHRRERGARAAVRRATRGSSRGRRGAQDDRTPPRPCCASWRDAGAERGDLVVAVGGGVVGRPRRLLRRDLPARDAPRAGADDAGGPGRLRLRRQDGRRPARGQELRGRLPPAVRRALRPGRARRPCRRRSWPPATRRSSRPR